MDEPEEIDIRSLSRERAAQQNQEYKNPHLLYKSTGTLKNAEKQNLHQTSVNENKPAKPKEAMIESAANPITDIKL